MGFRSPRSVAAYLTFKPNRAQLEHMAQNNPRELLSILDDLAPPLLTFAAEILGGIEMRACRKRSLPLSCG